MEQELNDLHEKQEKIKKKLLDTAKLIKKRNDAHIEQERKMIENHIEEYQLKIKALDNDRTKGWADETMSIYDKAIVQARNRVSQDKFANLLYDYARFLRWHYDRMDMLYDFANFSRDPKNKDCLNKYHLADNLFDECLSIYRRLAEHDPNTFLSSVAKTLDEMGVLHLNLHRYDEAEKEWVEALDIYKKLAENNQGASLSDIFMILNNLAVLHIHSSDHGINPYKHLNINLTEKNPDVLQSIFDDVSIVLANLHKKLNNHDKIENNYAEPLDKNRLSDEKDHDTFLTKKAFTLYNQAVMHKKTHNYEEAERKYIEALNIFKRLAAKGSKYFLPLALVLDFLGQFYNDRSQYAQARMRWVEALEIYQKLYPKTRFLDNKIKQITSLLEEIKDK